MNKRIRICVLAICLTLFVHLSIGQGNAIAYGDKIDSHLKTKIEQWEFVGGEGHTVSVGVDSTEIDAMVELQSGDGTTLIEDDNGGKGTNALIRDFVLPAQETYTIVVSSADNGSGNYSVSLSSLDQSIALQEIGSVFEFYGIEETSVLDANTIAEVYVQDEGLSLRASPEIADNLINKMPSGTQVTIIDGPVAAEGYSWWKVRMSNAFYDQQEGWSVESADGIKTLVPVAKLVPTEGPECKTFDNLPELSVEDYPLTFFEDSAMKFTDLDSNTSFVLDFSGLNTGSNFPIYWSSDGQVASFSIKPDAANLSAFAILNLPQKRLCKFQMLLDRGAGGFAWEPDTHDVLLSIDGFIYSMNADNHAIQRIETPESIGFPIWRPTGEQLVFGIYDNEYLYAGWSSWGLYTIQPDGSNLQHHFADIEVFRSAFGNPFAWSPDGTKIAALSLVETDSAAGATMTIFSMTDDSYQTIYTHNPPKNLDYTSGSVDAVVWTDDSKQLFMSSPDGVLLHDLTSHNNRILVEVEPLDQSVCVKNWDERILFTIMHWNKGDAYEKTYSVDTSNLDVQEVSGDICSKWHR